VSAVIELMLSPELLLTTLPGGDALDRGEHRRTDVPVQLFGTAVSLPQTPVANLTGHRRYQLSSTIPPPSSSFDNPLDDRRNLFAPGNADEDPTNWMVRGACRGTDPELFFPISLRGRAVEQINYAKVVCRRCAVSGSCLSYALRTMPDGIWGGTTSEERIAMRVRSAVRPPAPAKG
jgi:WhiB family transcriptional regulator, redox-sensing transcriptional regulator